MDFPLRDSTIEEILEQEDSEGEIVSETEDHEEHSEHDSDTEQEVDFDDISDINLHCEEDEEPISPVNFDKAYLEDFAVPQTWEVYWSKQTNLVARITTPSKRTYEIA